jgi:hypothetical protein
MMLFLCGCLKRQQCYLLSCSCCLLFLWQSRFKSKVVKIGGFEWFDFLYKGRDTKVRKSSESVVGGTDTLMRSWSYLGIWKFSHGTRSWCCTIHSQHNKEIVKVVLKRI